MAKVPSLTYDRSTAIPFSGSIVSLAHLDRQQTRPTSADPASIVATFFGAIGALPSVLQMLVYVLAIIVASFSGTIGQLWLPLQVLIYVAAGVAWIFPAKPIMRWIVTGRWRA
jgi:hypothetical protein